MTGKVIITISRQYGSGGSSIAKMLAEELGIPYYDKELISAAARESGLDEEILRNADEKATNSLLYSISLGMYGVADGYTNLPINDRLYITQSHIIRDVAEKGSCVIVGRCADYVLKDNPKVINIYIHSNLGNRIERIINDLNVDEVKAKNIIIKADKRRAAYYNYYTGLKWGKSDNYHLSVDSGCLGNDKTVALIKEYIKIK